MISLESGPGFTRMHTDKEVECHSEESFRNILWRD